MSRRRLGIAIILALVLAGAAFLAVRTGSNRRQPLAHPTSSRRPRPPASTTPTAADRALDVGGGVAVFDCDGDGEPDLFCAGGDRPGRALPQRQPDRRRPPVHRAPRSGDRPDRRSPAPTRSTSTATARSTSPSSGSADVDSCAAWATAGSSRRTRAGRSTAAPAGRPRSAPPGRAPRPCRRSRWATTSSSTRSGEPTVRLRRERARSGPPRGAGTGRPIALDPGLLHAVDAVQRLGPLGPARPARHERPPLLPRRPRSSSGASRPASRPGCTRPPTAGVPLQIWGMGIASQDLDRRRPSRDLPHEPGRQQAPDADRRADAADLRRHRACSAASPATQPFTGGDVAALDRLAPGVRRREQRRPRRPVRVQGQRRRPARLRGQGPERPVPGPARRHVRRGAPTPPGSSTSSGPRAPRSSTSTSTGCSTWSRSTSARRRMLWRERRVRGRRASAAADGPLDRAAARASPARTATRSARWLEVRPATASSAREVTVGGGHIGGQLGWSHVGLGAATRPRCGSNWPDGDARAVADGGGRQVRDRSRRGAPAGPHRGRHRSGEEATGVRTARLDGDRPARVRLARDPARAARRPVPEPARAAPRASRCGRAATGSSSMPTASTAPTSPTSRASTRASRRRS